MTAPAVRNVTDATFEAEVIARSRERPVVVDFWATWCGPCRTLGPLLEREVAALGGRVEMAKIDTDSNPALAARFSIQSIPAVKAFRDGRVVAEFVGAQPLPVIRTFLAQLAPSDATQALEGAKAAMASGDFARARSLLEPLLGDPEHASEVAFRLAGLYLDTGRAPEVEALAGKIDAGGPFGERVEPLRRLAAFATATHPGPLADAANAVRQASWEEALDQLLGIVASRSALRESAHRAMLDIFDHLGGSSDLVSTYRRKLQIVT